MINSLLITFLILLILTSAFLSASETALFSLSPMKVRSYAHGTDRKEQLIARLLSEPRKLLVTILIVNVCVNILVQNVVSGIFEGFSSWALVVGAPFLLTLIFGEVIPKSIAYPKNALIAYHSAPILRGVEWFLKPLRDGITFITSGVSKFFFFYLRKEKEIRTQELKIALRTSQEKGTVSTEEAKLVRGYLNLEETLIKEVMSPRNEILFFDINEPISKLIDLFVNQECSRVPVCNGNLENILGIMTGGSFFLHRDHFKSSHQIVSFLKKTHFVPESMVSRNLLRSFYEHEEVIALVVDEYGSVSGLIALEDLLETVVGQIADRRDAMCHYTQSSDDIIIASGQLELIEVEEIFDYHLESSNNMATIGGWITELLGDIPKNGTKFKRHGFLFHILASDAKRVRRVYIRRLFFKKRKKNG